MDNISFSKLVCLDPVLWIIFKLKSYKVLIHLGGPKMAHVESIVLLFKNV